MTYERFLNQAVKEIQEKLAEQGMDCKVTTAQVEKLQNQSYRGIQVWSGKEEISTSLNLTPYWERMETGSSYQLVIGEIVLEILSLLEEIPCLELGIPRTYEEIKNRLIFQIVSSEDNREMLSHLPHMELEDMSAVLRVDLGAYPDATTTALVTSEMMAYYGVTKAQMFDDAFKAAPLTHPAVVKRLDLLLNELSDGMFPEDENEGNPLYVISTESECYGAAVILYPGFLEKTADELESDFFLLPSSLHEMILVKDDGNLKAEELIQMVKEINASEVRAEDKLTDSVYHYNRKKQQFCRM